LQSNSNNDEQTQSYSALAKGSEVGRYSIIKKIGSGGMGEVYLAEDPDLGRRVALKFLPRRLLSDDQAKARFRREAQATARLSHPNVVTIHEVADHYGNPYIAMEYIKGETLDTRIKRAPLSPDETSEIITQVARGLRAAHELGVIHRDIKPGNICICDNGRAKILDFGLARVAGSDSLTKSDLVLGTVGYSSPEQISGGQIDKRTDIWALGILIHKMLTQKLPFEGDNPQAIMYSITHSQASDISTLRDDIPSPIQTLYRRCLEKNQDRRPQSMADVLEVLEVSSTSGASTRKFQKSPKVKIALLTFLSLIFVAVFILVLRSYLPESTKNPARDIWRVGILPFHNQTSQDELSAWPSIIQVLFAGNLTGIADIGIIDPFSLNAIVRGKFDTISPPRNPNFYRVMRDEEITYVIDGTIVRAGIGFQIHANVIEPTAGDIVYSCVGGAAGEETLPEAVDSLSKNILGFFQTMMLQEDYDKDIKPWLSRRTQSLEALKAFMQANEFIFNGIAGSDRYLKRALDLDSTFAAARIYLISGLVMRKDIEEAKKHHRILLKHEHEANPFERVMISWAGALIDNDARTQAKSLQLALEYSPGNNVLLYELARSLYTLGEFDQAIEALRPAIENNWRYSHAYYLMGITYCELDEYSKARNVLERSLSIPPVYEYTYGILASVALREGDNAAAERFEKTYLQELEGKGKSRGEVYAALAESHLFMGLDEDAIRCYKSAIVGQPDNPAFHCNLGELLYEDGQWGEARDEYLEVLDLDSQHTEAYGMLGIIHDSLADTSGAIGYYIKYLSRDSAGENSEKIRNRISSLQIQ
jgi:serine/threonine protein kinase/tetratricopeptide (TPR) repeat protein